MLLVYSQKKTQRLDYAFKHICFRILGMKVEFTSLIEDFIAYPGIKLSYGKQPIGNEFFIQAQGLLEAQGFEDIEISVTMWEDIPCFFASTAKANLPFDIFAASFYLLSRYEEYLPHVKDELGRFPATESLAYKSGFLQQPVIDIWAYKFKSLLLKRFPETSWPERSYSVQHLIDASQPFAFAQRGPVRNIGGLFRDLVSFRWKQVLDRSKVLLKLRKDPYDTFYWILNTAKHQKYLSIAFFLLGDGYTFRESLNTSREKFRLMVKLVADYLKVGLIFSYHNIGDLPLLKEHVKRMEELTHRSLEESSNHKAILNLPHIYRNLLELEVHNDYSMYYERQVGFRASTCTPFLFYDLDYEIKTPLVIYPVFGQSEALLGFKSSEILQLLSEVTQQIREVNGTFSFFYSNKNFVDTKENEVWRTLYSEKL